MQLIQQYHPIEATAFRQLAEGSPAEDGCAIDTRKCRVKGFVELAKEEMAKRDARLVELEIAHRTTMTTVNINEQREWQRRAQGTAAMAQRFKQAAADAVMALEAALSNREWDHKTIFKMHDFELTKMEAETTSLQDELQAVDIASMDGRVQHHELCDKITAIKAKTQAEEAHRSKTQKFMSKIGSLVKLEQLKESREKKQTLRLKQRELEATGNNGINA